MHQHILNLLHNAGISCIRCENVSYKHAGHNHFGENSHFEIYIDHNYTDRKDLLAAHKSIYTALKPIYPSVIHSISLIFRNI
jgi:stress-induced morphogen